MSGSYVLTGSRVEDLQCETTGDLYRIVTQIPSGDAPPEGWPVLYVLDADSCFGTCVEALKRMGKRPAATGVTPMVVVGITTPHGYDTARRQRDYTSARGAAEAKLGGLYSKPVLGSDAAQGEGKAAQFLAFIERQVKPHVGAKTAIDASRQTLCGHSLAGFFTLWVLANRTAAFTRYAAISPSVWWDAAALRNFTDQKALKTRQIFIAMGEWEDTLPPWQVDAPDAPSVIARRQARGMMQGAKDIAADLAAIAGQEQVRFAVMAEDDHASILCSAMPRILRLASGINPLV